MVERLSWRKFIKVHPAAALFPMMSLDELKALREDIKANGLNTSIVMYRGQLLDGRNRLDAMELAGLLVTNGNGELDIGQNLTVLGDAVDPVAYVVSLNIHRRHLTTEQRRELIGRLLKVDPTKSDRQIAKMTGTSPTTAGKVRSELTAKGDVSKMDTRTDTKGRKQPVKKSKPNSVKPPPPPTAVLERHVPRPAEPLNELPTRRAGLLGPVIEDDEPNMEAGLDEDPENFRTAYLLRVDTALRCAVYTGPILTTEMIAAARRVAAAWSELAQRWRPNIRRAVTSRQAISCDQPERSGTAGRHRTAASDAGRFWIAGRPGQRGVFR
jgi:hypothetical protein